MNREYMTDFTCRDCDKAKLYPDGTCECWRVGQGGAWKARHPVWHMCPQGVRYKNITDGARFSSPSSAQLLNEPNER